jgi:diaminopimelate epimerase
MGNAARPDLIFWKYHGLGNDFILVERAASEAAHLRELGIVEKLCDRRRGVGADGVLLFDRDVESADARMVLLNKDGSRPEMCGNGVRCIVRHLVEEHDVSEPVVDIATDAGVRSCRWNRDGETADGRTGDNRWQVSVMMGPADVNAEPVEVDDGEFGDFTFWRVNMGNPHAVAFEGASTDTVDAIGRMLNDDPRFPEGVNVEFVEASEVETSDPRLDVVVFERGVGRTLACGTGACGAAAAWWYNHGGIRDGRGVTVGLPGGDLEIEVVDGELRMTGPVRSVFKGQLASDALSD